MAATEFIPKQNETEAITAHVIWMTTGLSCDGDSVGMTSATNPSLEDIITGAIPGMPRVVVHNPVLAFEQGDEFMQAWYDAEAGKLDPFVLILEGSLPNEKINGDGYFAAMGDNPRPASRSRPTSGSTGSRRRRRRSSRSGRAPPTAASRRWRTTRPARWGCSDYLGWKWKSKAGIPIVNIPGCPAQPDNITETLMYLVFALAGMAPVPELDDVGRPKWLFERTAHESCNRAAFYEEGNFATEYGSDHRCLVKLGCKGPVVKCNVPLRGWVNGIGGCPNVGGICMACTMPGFPDKYMPFMDPDPMGAISSDVAQVHATARCCAGAAT